MTDRPRLTKRSCTPELASAEQLQILLVAKQKRIVKKPRKKGHQSKQLISTLLIAHTIRNASAFEWVAFCTLHLPLTWPSHSPLVQTSPWHNTAANALTSSPLSHATMLCSEAVSGALIAVTFVMLPQTPTM